MPQTLGCGCIAKPYGNLDLCKPCYMKRWRAAKKEHVAEYARNRRLTQPDKVKEQDRASRQRHAEKISARAKAKRTANLESYRAKDRARYWSDPEKYAAKFAAYYAKRRVEQVAKSRAYYQANPDAARAASREWKRKNPERQRVLNHRRRDRLIEHADLTLEQWLGIVVEFDGKCAYCGVADDRLVIEHMTPLSRGGHHTAANVVPACALCNGRKHAKTAFEFAGWDIPPQRRGL